MALIRALSGSSGGNYKVGHEQIGGNPKTITLPFTPKKVVCYVDYSTYYQHCIYDADLGYNHCLYSSGGIVGMDNGFELSVSGNVVTFVRLGSALNTQDVYYIAIG